MEKSKYTIKIRISEARNLMLRDDGVEETPNPFVMISVCNSYFQQTKVQFGKLNANFDECLLFDNIYLSKKEFEEGEILLQIMHKGPFYRFGPDLIGEYAMNMPSIYQKPNHQVRDLWAPVSRSTKAKVVFGYVLFDVMIIGENDDMPAYDLEKQDNNEAGDDEQEIDYDLLENLTLGQPKLDLKNHLLIISIYSADSITQSYIPTAMDPRVEIFFNGFLCKTDNGGNASPDWKMTYEIPFKMPCLSDRINIRLYTKKFVGSRFLAYNYLSLQSLMQNIMPATWINFYGTGDDNDSALDMVSKKDPKQKYQVDSMWNGRVLFSAYVKSALNPEFRKKGATDVRKPKESAYILWFDIYEVTGITSEALYGDVQIGSQRIMFNPGKRKTSKNQVRFVWDDSATNNGKMANVQMNYPSDEKQLPDIFINLYAQGGVLGGTQRVAFIRLKTTEFIQKGTTVTVTWQELTFINPMLDNPTKPFILFSLNFGYATHFKNRPVRYAAKKGKYEVWCQVINSKHLPFVDSMARTNAKVGITVNGNQKCTKTIEGQISPFWNQVVKFRTRLPNKLELSNDIELHLIHCSATGDAVLGGFKINPAQIVLSKSYEDPLPEAKWYYLQQNNAYNGGALYCSFLLHKLKNLNKIPSPSKKLPATKKCNLKVMILGTRKIDNHYYFQPNKPIVKLSVLTHNNSKTLRECETKQGSRTFLEGDTHHNYNYFFQTMEIEVPENGNYCPNLEVRVFSNLPVFRECMVGATSINLQKYSPFTTENQKKALEQEFDLMNEDPELRKRELILTDEQEQLRDSLQIENIQNMLNNKEAKARKLDKVNVYDNIHLFSMNLNESNYIFGEQISFLNENPDKTALIEYVDFGDKEKICDWQFGDNEFNAIDRADMQGTYEQEFPSSELMFEDFALHKYSGGYYKCGSIKMIIIIQEQVERSLLQQMQLRKQGIDPDKIDDMPILDFIQKYESSRSLECRIYLLNANNLKTQNEYDGIINPYIWVKTFNDDQEFKYENKIYKNNLDPEIMICFTLSIKIPDNNYVKLQFWDKDLKLGRDKMIGEVELDIENRYLHPKYQKIIKQDAKDIQIEKQNLYLKGVKGPQGAVRMWVEILDFQEQLKYDIIELPPPTVDKYEIRLVIWNTWEVFKTTKKIDIKVKCSIKDEIEGEILKSTDTHMGSKEGFGEFNWRMLFRIILPSSSPRLVMGIYSAALIGADVAIGESIIDLSKLFREVHKAKAEKKMPRTFVRVMDKNDYKGKIECELWILPVNESELNPVGDERKEPNRDPFLPYPETGRSFLDFLPDIDIGGLFGFFGMFKKMIMYGCCGCVGLFLVGKQFGFV